MTVTKTLRNTSKDVSYLLTEDRRCYYAWHPVVEIHFLDHAAIVVNTFNSQDKLKYRAPVVMPILMRLEDLKPVMDKYDLQEIPEGVAVISRGVLEYLGLTADTHQVEEDVLIPNFAGHDWRITKVYPSDFIANNNNEFLHYVCVLERMKQTNVTLAATRVNENYFYGAGAAGLSIESLMSLDVLNSVEDYFRFNASNQKLYFCFPQELGTLLDILDVNGSSVKSAWTLRTSVYDGLQYLIYESSELRTVTNLLLKFRIVDRPILVVDTVIDGTLSEVSESIEGQSAIDCLRITFIDITPYPSIETNILLGTNRSIVLNRGRVPLTREQYVFNSDGISTYQPIPYVVPVNAKLLILEEKYAP